MTSSPTSRFGGFAAGHFVVTALCAPLLFCLPYFFGVAVTPLGWALILLRVTQNLVEDTRRFLAATRSEKKPTAV